MIEKGQTAERNSSIELLRILCMLMIVAHHYGLYGFYAEQLSFSPNKSFVELLSAWGQTGVDVFVLISGYYMVKSSYSFEKFMSFATQVWTYAWIAFAAFFLLMPDSPLVHGEYISMAVMPLTKGHYWFASSFVVLMLLSPFLNRFMLSAERRLHLGAIAVLMLIYSILPGLFNTYVVSSSMARFIILYLIAGYVRLYADPEKISGRFWTLAAILLASLLILRIVLANYVARSRGDMELLMNADSFSRNILYCSMMALCLFMSFLSAKPFHNKWINRIAGLTFGVYLFHDGQQLRSLWQYMFHTSDYVNSPYLPLHALTAICVMFAMGALVEFVRQKTLGKLCRKITLKLKPLWTKLSLCVTKRIPG